MRKINITGRIIVFNLLFIFLISVVILSLKSYAKIIFYNHQTAEVLFNDVIGFLLSTILPLMVILSAIFYFYLKPLQLVVNKLAAQEPVADELKNQARKIIKRFPIFFIVFNLIAYIGAQIVTIIVSGLLRYFFEMREFSYTFFMLASSCLYAFGHITISNHVFAEPRKLLNIFYIDDNKKRRMGLRVKNILLFSIIIVYSLSFFTRFISLFFSKENYYARQMELVAENKITLAAAEANYKGYLHDIMDPALDKNQVISKIRFPRETREDRGAAYVAFFVVSSVWLFSIGFFISFLFSKEITMQIRNQRSTIRDILEGRENLSKRISIIQYDEVGGLTDMINTLMDKLKDILYQIKESSMTVTSSSDELNDKLLNTSSAVEQMVSSIKEIAHNIGKQMNLVGNTKENLEMILTGIDKITENIEHQVGFVEEASSAMQEMAVNIKSVNESTSTANLLANNLLRIAKEGNTSVQNTIDAIKKISSVSDHVLQIVEVITGISTETDMLALNAAIEAAHAGQSGKGFAIISSEIRKLAESSSSQSKEITDYITDMYKRIKHGVSMSEQAGRAFEKIDHDIEQTANLINQIDFAMNEQKIGSNEILASVDSVVQESLNAKKIAGDLKTQSQVIRDHMKDLYDISFHIDNATKEQDLGNREILSLIANVKDISTRNVNVVNKLKAIVASFNIESPRS